MLTFRPGTKCNLRDATKLSTTGTALSQPTLPKVKPVDVVRQAFSAIESARDEVLADAIARQVEAGLSKDPSIYLVPNPQRGFATAA